MKVFRIEPIGDSRFDILFVKSDETWCNALDAVERSLDSQFLDKRPRDIARIVFREAAHEGVRELRTHVHR